MFIYVIYKLYIFIHNKYMKNKKKLYYFKRIDNFVKIFKINFKWQLFTYSKIRKNCKHCISIICCYLNLNFFFQTLENNNVTIDWSHLFFIFIFILCSSNYSLLVDYNTNNKWDVNWKKHIIDNKCIKILIIRLNKDINIRGSSNIIKLWTKLYLV